MRCLADGGASIGYLRRDSGKIHRSEDDNENVLRSCLEEREVSQWTKKTADNYARTIKEK